jgi:ligand-binding sensor domain-containing protein
VQGVFRSTDNGDHWIPVNTGLINLQIQSLMVSINGDLYAGTNNGVHISTNNGDTWASMGTQTGVISDIGINSLGHIFVASWSGVFRTTNHGLEWKVVGMPIIPVNSISVNHSGNVFAGAYGIYRSSNNGEDWVQAYSDLTTSTIASNHIGHIFAGGRSLYSASIMSSTNGISWSGCLYLAQATTFTAIVIRRLGYIFAGATGGDNGIYRSEGNCNPWTQINTGLTNRSIRALAIADDSTIFAGTVSGGFRSTNYGALWNGMQFEGTVGASINAFTSSANSNLFAGTSAGVFRSTDLGLTWTRAGLINEIVLSLVSNSRGHLFAASYNGAYKSIDQGLTWKQLNSGLGNLKVNSLAIDSVGHVIAATDAGVFRSTHSTTAVKERSNNSPSFWALEQNYPNPFNPRTTIKFQIPNSSFVTLKVFDLLGREVAMLVNEETKPGTYERVFDGDRLASGVYLYQLRAGGFVQTKKLLVLR